MLPHRSEEFAASAGLQGRENQVCCPEQETLDHETHERARKARKAFVPFAFFRDFRGPNVPRLKVIAREVLPL
jgi:hypothetical protein